MRLDASDSQILIFSPYTVQKVTDTQYCYTQQCCTRGLRNNAYCLGHVKPLYDGNDDFHVV